MSISIETTINAHKEHLGLRVRSLRKQSAMSQKHLAEKATVNAKDLGEIERGQRNTSLAQMVKLAVALEVPLTALLDLSIPTAKR